MNPSGASRAALRSFWPFLRLWSCFPFPFAWAVGFWAVGFAHMAPLLLEMPGLRPERPGGRVPCGGRRAACCSKRERSPAACRPAALLTCSDCSSAGFWVTLLPPFGC